jgi:hypothetical protein
MNKLQWDELFWFLCRSWGECKGVDPDYKRYDRINGLAKGTDPAKRERVRRAGYAVWQKRAGQWVEP